MIEKGPELGFKWLKSPQCFSTATPSASVKHHTVLASHQYFVALVGFFLSKFVLMCNPEHVFVEVRGQPEITIRYLPQLLASMFLRRHLSLSQALKGWSRLSHRAGCPRNPLVFASQCWGYTTASCGACLCYIGGGDQKAGAPVFM